MLLDGKQVFTPARKPLAAPTRALAEAIAVEWNAQEDKIDPARMPLTRLANAAIDAVAEKPRPVAAEIEQYLGSDLLFYRAEAPEGLVARHAQHWDPVLAWAREKFGARFVLAQGIVHVAQPREAVAAMRARIPKRSVAAGRAVVDHGADRLGAHRAGAAEGALDVDAAWAAAHVDEDWQMSQWGSDELALARRDYRFAEMQAAATVLRLMS